MVVITIQRETLSTSIVFGDVRPQRLDAREGDMVRAREYGGNPFGVALVQIGLITHRLGIGEQNVDVLNTVILRMSDSETLERTRSVRFSGLQKCRLIFMRDGCIRSKGGGFILIKDIHSISFIRRMLDGFIIGIIGIIGRIIGFFRAFL